jgi:hypothetical protein
MESEENSTHRSVIFNKLADIYEMYSGSVTQHIGGQKIIQPKRIYAQPTTKALSKYNSFLNTLLKTAIDSSVSEIALPTFNRMSDSILKMAVVLAAVRQRPTDDSIIVEEGDVINAAWYIQEWGKNAIELMLGAGKNQIEKKIDKIYTYVETNPGCRRSDIMNNFRLMAREMDEVAGTLEQRGLITITKQGKGQFYWVR